jgi:hypothetical protein
MAGSSSLHGGIQPATSSQVCSDLAGLGTKPRNQGSAYEYATLRVEESSWPMTPTGSRCNRLDSVKQDVRFTDIHLGRSVEVIFAV